MLFTLVTGILVGVNVNTPDVLSYANAPPPAAAAVVTLSSFKAIPGIAGANVNTPDVLSYANEPPALALAVVVLRSVRLRQYLVLLVQT